MLKAKHYTRDKAGFDNEKRVKAYLAYRGFKVTASSKYDDINLDIDLWVGRTPVSLKSEQAGLKYGDIYFELATQIYNCQEWTEDSLFEAQRLTQRGLEGYRPGWFFSGKASIYGITQGSFLYLYNKSDVQDMLSSLKKVKTLGLSKSVRAGQSGRDTICAFLPRKSVPCVGTYDLSELDLEVAA